MQITLYGGRWWLPLSSGRGESSEYVLHVACPNTKSGSEGVLINLLVGFLCRIVVLKAGSGTKFQLFLLFNIVGPFFWSNEELGGASLNVLEMSP
jgi:hypothetical protein